MNFLINLELNQRLIKAQEQLGELGITVPKAKLLRAAILCGENLAKNMRPDEFDRELQLAIKAMQSEACVRVNITMNRKQPPTPLPLPDGIGSLWHLYNCYAWLWLQDLEGVVNNVQSVIESIKNTIEQ